MDNVTLASFPSRRFGVRKRISGGNIYLIRFTQLSKIDSFAETVWRHINGTNTLYEIVLLIRKKHTAMDIAQCIECTWHCITELMRQQLLEISETQRQPYPLLTTQLCYIERMAELMQHFFKGEQPWYHDINQVLQAKIMQRFFRIIYEMYTAEENTNIASEEQFKQQLGEKFLLSEDLVIEELSNHYRLYHWNFCEEENKITISYKKTVYVGDLDNRL